MLSSFDFVQQKWMWTLCCIIISWWHSHHSYQFFSDSDSPGPPQNIRYWIKFVSVCYRVRYVFNWTFASNVSAVYIENPDIKSCKSSTDLTIFSFVGIHVQSCLLRRQRIWHLWLSHCFWIVYCWAFLLFYMSVWLRPQVTSEMMNGKQAVSK